MKIRLITAIFTSQVIIKDAITYCTMHVRVTTTIQHCSTQKLLIPA